MKQRKMKAQLKRVIFKKKINIILLLPSLEMEGKIIIKTLMFKRGRRTLSRSKNLLVIIAIVTLKATKMIKRL